MISKKELLSSFKLYAITDVRPGQSGLEAKVEEAFRGGADVVQLRAKNIMDGELLRLAVRIRQIANQARKLFIVNDRADIALLSEADGVHVGQEDVPIEAIRRLTHKLAREFFIGKSTHSLSQALSAERDGADYIGVGPIFATPTKPGRASVGLELVQQVTQAHLSIPFVAIGGIDLTNIQQVLEAGAAKAACVRAIFDQEDIYDATRQLLRQWETISHGRA